MAPGRGHLVERARERIEVEAAAACLRTLRPDGAASQHGPAARKRSDDVRSARSGNAPEARTRRGAHGAAVARRGGAGVLHLLMSAWVGGAV